MKFEYSPSAYKILKLWNEIFQCEIVLLCRVLLCIICRSLHVIITEENVHFVIELLISEIVFQMKWYRVILLIPLRIDLINIGLIKRFCLISTLTWLELEVHQFVLILRCEHKGFPAPVGNHWTEMENNTWPIYTQFCVLIDMGNLSVISLKDNTLWKFKMAAAAILENTQKGISRPILDQFAPNLIRW